jgi:hypothetical protein
VILLTWLSVLVVRSTTPAPLKALTVQLSMSARRLTQETIQREIEEAGKAIAQTHHQIVQQKAIIAGLERGGYETGPTRECLAGFENPLMPRSDLNAIVGRELERIMVQ